MLKKISNILSPSLLKVLCEMGHGDELVIGDGNFPSESVGQNAIVIRLDGHNVPEVLTEIIKFFPLDTYVPRSVGVMATLDGSKPTVWNTYEKILLDEESEKYQRGFEKIERFAFYERAKHAYAIIATSENALYANIILKKGTC